MIEFIGRRFAFLVIYELFILPFCISNGSYGLNQHGEVAFGNSSNNLETENRDSRFFPLFTIIRFTNEECRTENSEQKGICYTRTQCLALGGLSDGSCAQGLGVCCRFIVGCGGTATQNNTYFQNVDYPNKYKPSGGAEVCQLRIRKPRKKNICKLKLLFHTFDIAQPSSVQSGGLTSMEAGTCKTDSMTISSSGEVVPSLCGKMSGQHIFVNFGSNDQLTLNLLLGGESTEERTWNIELIQVPCTSTDLAPTGCLQYFTGVTGMIQSFNYEAGQHLANMEYSACVRLEEGMGSINWSPCSDGSVSISGRMVGGSNSVACMNPGTNANPGANDFLIIMGAMPTPPIGAGGQGGNTPTISQTDRICDNTFINPNTVVRTRVKPFIIHFHSDDQEAPSVQNAPNDASTGFCLKWQQSPN